MLEHWHDFFLAQVGASAALAGLMFVGISINLKDILGSVHLVNRALETILGLLLVLLVASLALFPEPSGTLLGVATAVLALGFLSVIGVLDSRAWASVPTQYRRAMRWHNSLGMGVALPYLAGGLMLLWALPWSLGVLAFGMLLSICVAIYNAWVLVIEILR